MARLLTKTASRRSVIAGNKAYRELQTAVSRAGILDRSYLFYILMTGFTIAGLFVSAYNIYFASSNISIIAWGALPFLVFDIQKAVLLFLVVNFTTGVYMSNVFAPNHKGMPEIKKGVKLSFLEQQVITARNIYGNWLTDFVYMGLNYQIEHHLFPNCPRNKLHKITPYLLTICKKMKLEYSQVGVLESNKIILSELKQISASS